MPTPYRDDVETLRARHDQLAEELSAVKKRVAELEGLKQAELRLEGELDAVRHRLDGIAGRRGLPLLEGLRVASPCSASWDEMEGDERVRFCLHCEKHVYNLSGMPREQAERLVSEAAGPLCVRLYRRADGTVLTADCPVGARRRRVRNLTALAVGGGLLAVGAMVTAREAATPLMGAIEGPLPPQAALPDTGAPTWRHLDPSRPPEGQEAAAQAPSRKAPAARAATEAASAPGDEAGRGDTAHPDEKAYPGDEAQPDEGAQPGKAQPRRRGRAQGATADCKCAVDDALCSCL